MRREKAQCVAILMLLSHLKMFQSLSTVIVPARLHLLPSSWVLCVHHHHCCPTSWVVFSVSCACVCVAHRCCVVHCFLCCVVRAPSAGKNNSMGGQENASCVLWRARAALAVIVKSNFRRFRVGKKGWKQRWPDEDQSFGQRQTLGHCCRQQTTTESCLFYSLH